LTGAVLVKVQLLDLAAQYRKIKKEVLREVKQVCESQHYILGKNVAALESEIAAYSGAKYAIGVASGTDAILIALMAVGVKAGDKVVTTRSRSSRPPGPSQGSAPSQSSSTSTRIPTT
jgi:dTDP-4-amino-4,6-dideoxygalactose transaminase